jgi:hypothetical protein
MEANYVNTQSTCAHVGVRTYRTLCPVKDDQSSSTGTMMLTDVHSFSYCASFVDFLFVHSRVCSVHVMPVDHPLFGRECISSDGRLLYGAHDRLKTNALSVADQRLQFTCISRDWRMTLLLARCTSLFAFLYRY